MPVVKISLWATPCVGIDGCAFMFPAVFADYTDNWAHIGLQLDADSGAAFVPVIWTGGPQE